MSHLSNANIRADIREEMDCQGFGVEDLAEAMEVSVDELNEMLDPAHDLTLDELNCIMWGLDSDIRYEVVPR